MAIAITNPNSSKAYVFAEKAEDLTVTGLSTSSELRRIVRAHPAPSERFSDRPFP